MEKIYYSAKGWVLGNLWGGGKGPYPSSPISADTYEELLKLANEKLEDGSLDSRMGFDGLIGAILDITKYSTIDIEGKSYTNEEYFEELIGDLTEEDQDYLYNCLYNQF